MKRKLIAAAIIAAIFSTAALAQMGPGMMGGYGPGERGPGPGMMEGYGPGYGMGPGMWGYGPGGYGMGPGMMRGYGPRGYGMGPGMMGGYGYGMGPGMMGGYGYGMGPGMMGGYGYGMGPGMMGGYGYGMGPGMMGGYGPGGYNPLKLSDEQRGKIADIQEDVRRKQWALMSSMHELQFRGRGAEAPSDAEARKLYQASADLHKQMFENSLDARKRINAVLTKEQREQLRRGWGGR